MPRRSHLKIGLIVFGIGILSFIGSQPAIYVALGIYNNQNDYVLIGWNDLGMHSISPSYNTVAILPPYNNLMVQNSCSWIP
jgi:hypothetical protein